jgi:hypothetical protein
MSICSSLSSQRCCGPRLPLRRLPFSIQSSRASSRPTGVFGSTCSSCSTTEPTSTSKWNATSVAPTASAGSITGPAYSSRIRRGDDYDRLEPVVCIVFLAASSPSPRFHSVYEAREAHNQLLLADTLAIHVIELPRTDQAETEGAPADLERWARFLRFDSERALESLAVEDAIMAEAKSALEILSREPSAQRIAEMRREAEIARRLDRADDRAKGRAEGRVEGRAEGEIDSLRETIHSLCRAFAIDLDDARRERLHQASADDLRRLRDAILERRVWP